MNTTSRSILAAAALALMLAACEQREPGAFTQEWKGDPSLPDAKTALAKDAAHEAKAPQDAAALQATVAPQEKMTKAQESQAMPLPGQANDHSSTALDKNKGS